MKAPYPKYLDCSKHDTTSRIPYCAATRRKEQFLYFRVVLLSMLLQLYSFTAKADLSKDAEPAPVSTCQPVSATSFTTAFTVGRGPGCSNLSSTGNVVFIWEYFNGSIWTALSSNTPSGFSYAAVSVRTGSGSGAQITNTLTITFSSTASTGSFSFRCRANQPTGCTNFVTSNTVAVTVHAKPVPTFTAQPGPNACVNTAVTYTTQASQSGYTWGIPGIAGIDYSITGGSITSNSVTLQWLTAGSKTVTVNYTNADGCTATSPVSSTATMVNTAASPGFTAQPSGTVCTAADVTYTTQAGQTNYLWALPGAAGIDYVITSGGTGTGSNTVTLQWLTTGSKAITINYTNIAGCSAAAATSSSTVLVAARPVPAFTSSPAANSCAGVEITYTTSPGASNYTWSVPGTPGIDYTIVAGGTGTGNNAVILQWLSSGSKAVTVNYTNAAGCSGTAAASSTTTVNIPATPTITAGSNTAFCAGGSVELTATNGSGHQWFSNGNLIVAATAISYTAVSPASYTVRVTDALGCEALSAPAEVIIHPLPAADFAAQSADVCFSTSAQATTLAYTNDMNNPVTYNITWDAAAGAAGFTPVVNATITASPLSISIPAGAIAATYTGSITLSNPHNCVSVPHNFTVTITDLPDISNFTVSAADGCETAGAVITVSSSALANGTYSITYDLSGANTATGNIAAIVFSGGTGSFTAPASSQGITNITVTQLAGVACAATVTTGNTASFTIHPLPLVSLTLGPDEVCKGNNIVLLNTTPGGAWTSSDINFATVNSAGVVTGITAGAVDIIYTTAPVNGCINSVVKNITVNAVPAVTPITGSATLCVNTSTSLAHSSIDGTWASSNTETATISNAGLVTGLGAGTSVITYILPANANGCTDSTTITVTVDPVATATAGTGVAVCESASPVAIVLSGASVGGAASTGAWSILSGGGSLSTVTQTANPAAVTYTPAANYSGLVSLVLTTNAPGSCTAAVATRMITVTQQAAVNAGSDLTVCQSASPSAITLSGASVGGGAATAAWSIIAGGGSLGSIIQTATPSAVSYTPAAGFTGTVILRLTTDVPAGCAAVSDERQFAVTASPIAAAGTAVVTCSEVAQRLSGLASINITAGATAANQSGIVWSSGGTGSFVSASSLTTATYTPSVADISAGSVTLTLTVFGNSPCGNAVSTKILTITPAININDANSWGQAPNCNGLGVQFTLPAPPGGGNGSFSYQWMQKNNCGTAGLSSAVPGATGMSFIPTTDNCYWLQISSGGCTVPQSLVSTTTRQRPSPDTGALANISFGISGTNPQICIGSNTTLTAQSSVSYTYSWSPSTGLSSTTGASVVANPASTTTYTITAVATDGTGCTRVANNTVTVNPLTVAGSLPASATACASGSAVINLSGNTGSVVRWESSPDGGVTWTTIPNNTAALNYTIAATATLYRALVQSGACAAVFTNATQTGLHNVWQGAVSTDWHTAANWSDQALPSLSCPVVTIPAATPYSPILNTGVTTINSIVINPLASLVISNNARLQVAGGITNNGIFDVSDGALEFNGTSAQSISGNTFVANTLRNLVLSNSNGLAVDNQAGNLLHIKEAFAFGNVNNATLTTNDNLVLLSTAAGTAQVADITNNNINTGNSISGRVTIQRYIPGRRAWRLLTAPVTPSSLVKISDSWQEGAPRVTSPHSINSTNNPNPGFGTHVTFGNPAVNGYDQGVNGNASVFYLTSTGWNGVPTATNNGGTVNSGYITDQPGYMLFVRGDRSTQLWQATYAAVAPTVLRIKGHINSGPQNISLSPGMVWNGSQFRVVGNPYPSAVNFHKIVSNAVNSSAGFADAFYLWEPAVTGSNGVGGWVAMSYNSISGLYDRTVLTGGSSTLDNNGDIQSGSAVVIDYAGAATSLRVEEPNKASGSNNSQFRPMYQPNQVRVTLLAKNQDSSISVNDGVLVTFHESFNNAVDRSDMKKLLNFAENIAVVKDSIALVLERRKTFERTDSIQLQLSKMRQKNYQLQVELDNLTTPEGTVTVLEDKVLGKQEIITAKATHLYDFTVNAENILAANDRFRILFRQLVNFTSINGHLQKSDVLINWQLASEFNVDHFELERSEDGIHFSVITFVQSAGNTENTVSYTALDVNPANGNYYYRVKTVGKTGAVVYSNSINIKVINRKNGFYVFPNPVKGPLLQLQMNSVDMGTYQATLLNLDGKQMLTAVIRYTGGMQTSKISLPAHTAPGTYLLEITGADGNTTSLKVLVSR